MRRWRRRCWCGWRRPERRRTCTPERPGPSLIRCLFVTPECAPLTKTGGLGDVSAALPAALRAAGLDVRTLLPGYPAVLRGLPELRPVTRLAEGRLLESGPFLVFESAALFEREGGPYADAGSRDWPDNPLRFAALCRAAAAIGRGALEWRPEVVHANDWPCGLVGLLSRAGPAAAAPTLMTVHNLAFQGLCDASWVERLGLPGDAWSLDGAEFHGRLSFLKAGLAYADAITTVSPTYAREILTEPFGCGLDGFLRHRGAALSGIANGIDTAAWDPATDAHLAQRYDAGTLEKKAANKAALQRRLGLEVRADLPLFGMVARLTGQKGADLVLACLREIPGQVAVLGKGEAGYEEGFSAAAGREPGRIGFVAGFDEGLAHLIEAGADVFLMPSRFEPCGLNQMYSQRYGTPPVARATGGLADTVEDGVTGFLFDAPEPQALLAAVRRAAGAWREPGPWRRMQREGMARDFSWSGPARRYAALYAALASRRGP